MPQTIENVPDPVRKRLPKYLIFAREVRESGSEWVSSVEIAAALNLTSSTVRQDLSHFQMQGVSKKGYRISRLENVLQEQLVGEEEHRVVIVGAGFIGSALAGLDMLPRQQFRVVAVLDMNPEIIGTAVNKDLLVRSVDSMPHVVKNEDAEIGVIAVPASAAQEVADNLVAAGIKGILNLAYIQVRVPDHIAVQEARLVADLQELAFLVREKTRHS